MNAKKPESFDRGNSDGPTDDLTAAIKQACGEQVDQKPEEIMEVPKGKSRKKKNPELLSTIQVDTRFTAHFVKIASVNFEDPVDPINWLLRLWELIERKGATVNLSADLIKGIIKEFEEHGFYSRLTVEQPGGDEKKFRGQVIETALFEILHYGTLQPNGSVELANKFKKIFGHE